ncbi:hypothetical protein R6Q59_015569 [Mikania micrantha]
MDEFTSQQLPVQSIENVVVHPLVLLSVVDHYNRVSKNTRKRVIGALLGSSSEGTVDVTDSFAVPFTEDENEPDLWSLDDTYIDYMLSMLARINEKEDIVGWYSTGPELHENDLGIHCLFKEFVSDSVLVIIDMQSKEFGMPTKAYCDIAKVKKNIMEIDQRVFVHVPSEIAADELEEIGVKHLFRDVMDTTIDTLEKKVTGKLAALKGLEARLKEILEYLDLVIDDKLPRNHEILNNLQEVFNLLPNLIVPDLLKAFAVKTNDQMHVIYLSSLIRSVIALHNMIINQVNTTCQYTCKRTKNMNKACSVVRVRSFNFNQTNEQIQIINE